MITKEVKEYIEKSVLCWLATSNKHNEPNVSPKEIFTFKDDKKLLIANVASPNSVNNIKDNPNVCVSFVDVFVQKGFKLKGKASLIEKSDVAYKENIFHLTDIFTDEFPIKTIIEIEITKVETILAPSYYLYPERTEEYQVESAMKTYKVKPAD